MKIFQIIIEELFYASTTALAILVLLESMWRGIVVSYVNLNYLLLLWLVNGIILLYTKKD